MPRGIYPEEIKQKALELRKQGFIYPEIQKRINYPVPKNTFTGWFKNIILSEDAKKRIILKMKEGGAKGRILGWQTIQNKRKNLLESIYKQVENEITIIDSLMAKVSLAMLYLGEGGKTSEHIRFSNSDPKIIELFLKLLRQSFSIDEQRLHGKVQCRADQDIEALEIFWSEKSRIPTRQFHKGYVDKRTIGKPTERLNYKGVFIVVYCSNAIFLELKFISDIICKRLSLGL